MANSQVKDLTALASPDGEDLLYVQASPATTAVDRKLSLSVLSTFCAEANPWQPVSGGIAYDTGNVGIGTTTPAATLDVQAQSGQTEPTLRVVGLPYDPLNQPSLQVWNSPSYGNVGNMDMFGNLTVKSVLASTAQLSQDGLRLGATNTGGGTITWSSTPGEWYADPNVGISNPSTGVLQITDGSTGLGNLTVGQMTARVIGIGLSLPVPSATIDVQGNGTDPIIQWRNSYGSVVGGASADGNLTVGALVLTPASSPPQSSGTPGVTGQMLYSEGNLYVCTAGDLSSATWKYVTLNSIS